MTKSERMGQILPSPFCHSTIRICFVICKMSWSEPDWHSRST